MASARRLRTTSRQTSKSSGGIMEKDEDGGEKSKQKKRKLSDMLGPPWTEEDLDAFYQAYRKHGKNWQKVSSILHERNMEMIEALYGMNKAYLSLPEGAASAAGLKAMMTDHYNILEENRSDEEDSSEKIGMFSHSCKDNFVLEEKLDKVIFDKMDSKAVLSTYNGLSPAKRRRTVRSRMVLEMPQIFAEDHGRKKGKDSFSRKQEPQAFHHAADQNCKLDKVKEVVMLTSAKASNCTISPQVSHTSFQKAIHSSDKKNAALRNDSTGSDYKILEQKVDKCRLEPCKVDVVACMQRPQGEEDNSELVCRKPALLLTDKLSPERIKKRSRQLFCGDESSGLDTLATLADLSLNGLLPSPTLEQAKHFEGEDACKLKFPEGNLKNEIPEGTSQALVKVPNGFVRKGPEGLRDGLKSKVLPAQPLESRKKKRRAYADKLAGHGQTSTRDPHLQFESEVVPTLKQRNEAKCPTNSKGNLVQPAQIVDKGNGLHVQCQEVSAGLCFENQSRTSDNTDSSMKVSSKKKTLLEQKLVDNPFLGSPDQATVSGVDYGDENKPMMAKVLHCPHLTAEADPFTAKTRLIHCLSSPVQRWSTFEWFYSAIDLPWFSQNEFVEYLNHAGLGKIPKLTRVEWGVIRSSLGKPRRFSNKFLLEEREKLEKFRDDARRCYLELRSGIPSFLPADLARPLTVGQCVIARHPRTRQIHDGSILTVDLNKCRVQFDRPDLGVEFVPDIDVMPLHPIENMSELMRSQRIIVESLKQHSPDARFGINGPICDAGGAARAALNERLERPGLIPAIPAPPYSFLNTLCSRAQTDTVDSVAFAKAAAMEAAMAVQQATFDKTISAAQAQAREADIRVLAELSRALDKKEALLVELRNMNDEVDRNMKEVEAFQSSAIFQRQYATVVLQLKEVNQQVSSALLQLRHRNKYQDPIPPVHAVAVSHGLNFSSVALSEPLGPTRHASLPSVEETIATAKNQARVMVFTVMKAMNSLKDGEDTLLKLGGALSRFTKDNCFGAGPLCGYNQPENMLHADMALHTNGGILCTDNDRWAHDAPFECLDHKPSSIDKESTHLTELMASCVATLLMVQACTDTHLQPSRAAALLTSALENLRPRSAENQQIYHEIELCFDTLQSQILTQIPVEPNVSSSLSFCYSRK